MAHFVTFVSAKAKSEFYFVFALKAFYFLVAFFLVDVLIFANFNRKVKIHHFHTGCMDVLR